MAIIGFADYYIGKRSREFNPFVRARGVVDADAAGTMRKRNLKGAATGLPQPDSVTGCGYEEGGLNSS